MRRAEDVGEITSDTDDTTMSMLRGIGRTRKVNKLPDFPETSGEVVLYIMNLIKDVNATSHRPQQVERKFILRGLRFDIDDVRIDLVPRKHDPINRAMVQALQGQVDEYKKKHTREGKSLADQIPRKQMELDGRELGLTFRRMLGIIPARIHLAEGYLGQMH